MATQSIEVPRPRARPSVRAARDWILSPPGWVAVATLVSLAVTAWWLANDTRVPSWDPGAHMFRSLQYADAFRDGDLTEWFTSYQTPGYPPLVYLLGAFVSLVVGEGVTQFVLTQNLVFLPLLALGTYQAGRLAFGARTGALAAIFVLGSPLVIAQSHVFMLDMPQTAITAVTVWLLLASRRFELGEWAFAAGVAFGLGMLSKNIFSLMLLGLLAVAFLRGGWRQPKGLALFALGVAITGLPWYLAHFDGLLDYALGGSVSGGSSIYGADPPRWGADDWTWYLEAALNVQYYVPLWLFGVAGTAWAVVRLARRGRTWAPEDVTPELLGGLAFGILASVALTHNDVRYTMPLVIYVGILGTAWFATSRLGWLRVGGAVALVAVCALNLLTTSTGEGPDARLSVDRDSRLSPGSDTKATLFSTAGWLVGEPLRAGDVQGSLEAAREQGARLVVVDRVGARTSEYNPTGLAVLTRFAGLEVAPENDYAALGPRDVFVTGGESAAEPCGHAGDATPIYYQRGGDVQPIASADNLVCPERSAATYASPTEAAPDPAARRELLEELRAARAQGAREAYFQESVAASPLFGGAAEVQALARRAGLEPPAGRRGVMLADDGVFVALVPGYDGFDTVRKISCLRLPDDSGLVLLKGPPRTQVLSYEPDLWCPTRSPETFAGPAGG